VKLVLATRRSPLALWQAGETKRLLEASSPELEVELCEVHSAGDQDRAKAIERFGRIGVFTVEVDQTVLDGRADAAVHSLKDVPTTPPEGIRLAGILPRGPVEDAWLSRGGQHLADLPAGSRVATGSIRRAAMLRALRPDLETVGIRGNVDTRLAKLEAGEADAMILARAGLVRLGLADRITEVLDTKRFLPATGQGLIGLSCRTDDEETRARLHSISDLESFDEGLAERGLLEGLRGGCHVPVGAHARVVESALHLRARVLAVDGSRSLEAEITGSRDHATQLGHMLAEELVGLGAEELVRAAREPS